MIEEWRERQHRELQKLMAQGRYNYAKSKAMISALDAISEAEMLIAEQDVVAELRGLEIGARQSLTAFLAIEPPARAKLGDEWRFQLIKRAHQDRTVLGGSTYSVRILAPHK